MKKLVDFITDGLLEVISTCDKAGLDLGLSFRAWLGSRLCSRVLNNKKIILLTWKDLVLGCNYKTKGKEKEKKEKKSARREKRFM